MKKIIQFSLLTAVVLGPGLNEARAGDEAWAAIGGFVAGVITGVAIEDGHHVHHRHPPAHYGHHKNYGNKGHHGPPHVSYHRHHGKKGHWEYRKVRVWVPGHWAYSYDSCGSRVRYWESGYYSWQKNKVWVPHRKHGRHRGH